MSKSQPVAVSAVCDVCGPQRGTYRMSATCRNCGQRVVVTISRGHAKWEVGRACPTCGCSSPWIWGDLVVTETGGPEAAAEAP